MNEENPRTEILKKRLAVDIALLPPVHVMDKALEINRELSKKYDNKITLDKDKCIPHITIAMGCVSEEDMPAITGKLKEVSGKFQAIDVETQSMESIKPQFVIENTKSLQRLHEAVMRVLTPFFGDDVTGEMLYKENGEAINALTIDYIKDFSRNAGFGNFCPHITLGSGEMTVNLPAMKFRVSRLAVCHLGNFCTCRKVLLSYELS